MKADLTKATPGPWVLRKNKEGTASHLQSGLNGPDIAAYIWKDEDAALIAKAPLLPEMAEALRKVLCFVPFDGSEERDIREAIQDALAKYDAES